MPGPSENSGARGGHKILVAREAAVQRDGVGHPNRVLTTAPPAPSRLMRAVVLGGLCFGAAVCAMSAARNGGDE
jgi:hypothetical protein